MKPTKLKILEAALQLFNKNGIVNVRLQHIADEAFISVGNLAYHYPNKEAIAMALYNALAEQQEELMKEYRVVPLFENIDLLITQTYHLQQKYLFFYLDTLEILRAYPSVAEVHRQKIALQINQLQNMITFNVARGALTFVHEDNNAEQLAHQLWKAIDFTLTQEMIYQAALPSMKAFKQAIWTLLYPYFTQMGQLEYQQMLQHPYDFFFGNKEQPPI
jgi:AcrR family transcriptional regulator